MQYLREQGITDATVIARYRLGVGDDGIPVDFDQAELHDLGLLASRGGNRNLLAAPGVRQFTFEPPDVQQPVGVITCTPAQNKHRFLTHPRGLGCADDINDNRRIILGDSTLLMLRLAQAGIAGAAVAEDPAVLAPIRDWLADRDLFVAAYREGPRQRLLSALKDLGLEATPLNLAHPLHLSERRSLDLLGFDPDELRGDIEKPPITPQLLHDLHAYAVSRIESGEAAEALAHAEADDADYIRSLGVGYLPPDYQDTVSAATRQALRGQRLGRTLIIPAADERGEIVDFLIVHAHEGGQSHDGLFEEPRGLLCARVVGAAEQLVVTDTFRWAARLYRQGYCDLLLLRGPTDAIANAERIARAGVRQVTIRAWRNGEEIANAFRGVGIFVRVETAAVTGEDRVTVPTKVVSPPAIASKAPSSVQVIDTAPATEPAPDDQTDDLRLVEFDADDDVAIFEAGPVRYAIQLGEPDLRQRQVVARRGKATHQDRITLDTTAQIERFASSASRRIGFDASVIVRHLREAWRQVQAHEQAEDALPVVILDDEEQADAEALLRRPDLLQLVIDDLTTLGWVGEDQAKGLLYLTAISRLLPEPVWGVYQASTGAAPWRSMGLIAALTPPEGCLVFHRLTEALLRQTDGKSLRHRVLFVDRAEGMRPEAAVALRAMGEWGSVGWQQVLAADGVDGSAHRMGLLGEAQGPVAVLAAAAGDLDLRCRDSFLAIPVDESPEQTAAILAAQRQQHGNTGPTPEQVQAIIARHHGMQRLLRPSTVVIPFAERIAFPMTSVRHRREHAFFLGLIEASTLLHQFQRERDADGVLIADEIDFENARTLSAHFLGVSAAGGLSAHGRHLLQRLFATGTTDFTLADLGELVPDWTYYTYRAAAEELVHMGHCTGSGGGRGRKRTYTLTGGDAAADGIRLAPAEPEYGYDQTLRVRGSSRAVSQGLNPQSQAV